MMPNPRLFAPALFFCLFFFAVARSAAPQTQDPFASDASDISISYHVTYTTFGDKPSTQTADFFATKDFEGVSYRADYHFGSDLSLIVLFYHDVDPFMYRFVYLPKEKICYRNRVYKKDSPFDLHLIDERTLWESFLDDLENVKSMGNIQLLGEESTAGYDCRKISLADPSKDGEIVWFSPKLDLIVKSEQYRDGKLVLRQEASQIREGDPPPGTFSTPPGVTVKDLTNREFEALDIGALSRFK